MMQRGAVWRQQPAVLTDETTALQLTYLSFQKKKKAKTPCTCFSVHLVLFQEISLILSSCFSEGQELSTF